MPTTYEFGERKVAPFATRVRAFLRLPLNRAVLLRIAALAAGTFAAWLLLYAGAAGFWLLLVASCALLAVGGAYGFRIVERSSKGYLVPSDYSLTDESAVSALLPFKFAALAIGFLAVTILCGRLLGSGDLLVVLVGGLALAAALPAIAARLVTTGSLRGACAPLELLHVVRTIGRPYALLAGFAAAALLVGVLALYVLGVLGRASDEAALAGVGSALLAALLAAVFWYLTYAMCAAFGYAMYEYADALEIGLLGRGEERLKSSTGRHANVKARRRDALIGQMMSHGEVREAIALLNDDLAQRPTDLSLHARLHKLLLAENYGPRIEDHTEKYLALLVKSQNWREALDLADEALARRADWSPRAVELVVPLARSALQKGRAPLAATLIRGFDKKHPNHPDVPQVYLIGAQLMAESARKPDEARRILQYLLQRYAHDPAAAEARRYLATI
jgi:hypothetical protein